ncbi:M61 family metallopeptidase [Tenuifilum thalassicum]|uniref:Peptidase M61 catalytic domain-containing protein n=1 Tax=Tenuifilum thalassicum TaxID=2590900 RepID=A0A7D3XVJ2_9BACT|nr:hypothetical protein [Tenuifilum thalassicum]QKG79908.1 hypothetical protein FHG85_06410 [Tenuifilum thalassicum]
MISINDTVDIIEFDNYKDLINSPVIYSSTYSLDTISISNSKFNIYTHSNQGNTFKIKEIVSPVIKTVFKELNFLNIEEYTFTFIFNSEVNPDILDFAALEHPNSSVYLMFSTPDFSNKEDSVNFCLDIKHIVAHEILHLFTPITFSDSKVANHTLSMSGHLWLYEGFVEYQSLKILLKNKIISLEEFLDVLEQKLRNIEACNILAIKLLV